jgi:cold shock CspA family protein
LPENSTRAAELISKHFPIGGKLRSERKFEKSSVKQRFQLNLLALEKYFENALSSLRLNENHMLFVDGIDIRPDSVPYEEYLDCVKGLANAVWSVNNDFFPSVRDSEGRLRVALLVRPDIFNSLGLQNRNTKLRDNAVVLDWKTTYEAHRTSNIFKMADQMFSAQQDHKMMLGVCWDHYFPFHAATVKYPQSTSPTTFTSFIVLLRYSFHRPRDILTILDILKEMYVVRPGEDHVFQYKDLFTPEFRRAYGEYALGEIKDSLSFYYDASEFDSFLKFFEYLEGRNRFTYEQYIFAYDKFLKFQISQKKKPPEFMKSPQDFLQFLYELNIICFIEDAGDERFIRWCFIERTASNISPKVKSEMEYEIHYGLANALNTGKPLRGRRRPDSEISTFPLLDYAQPVPTQPVPPAAEEPRAPVQSSGRRSRSTAPAKREHSGGSAPTKRALGKQSVQSGVIKWFDARKSYGFIIREDLPFDIYFARSSVMFRGRIRPGQHVEFEIVKDGDGRITATNVRVMSPE